MVTTLIELPLVMPPAVAGIALLAAFGPSGIFGTLLDDAGIELVLQTAGVIVALTFVAAPFYLRQAQAAFAAVDPDLAGGGAHARRRRGTGLLARRRPLRRGRGSPPGMALAWGRALGEFGATLMFAGSFQGITQTAPLAIFAQLRNRLHRQRSRSPRCWSRSRRAPALGQAAGRSRGSVGYRPDG